MESPQQQQHHRAQLGKYTLVAEIARGGMGVVYLAQMSGPAGFQKLLVVKHLKPELAEDEKFREMFLDEARLAARLNHRNIVQTNEVGEDDGKYFMAMEYLEGRTLQSVRNRLKGEKALSHSIVLRIACEVLAALHYAHELTDYDGRPLRIVHRDVSPQNVFLSYDGHVKLLDFGVAKAYGHAQETQAGMLKGRVVCMSPEHVGNDDVDRRADIFSMGVMLRETLTGTRLWDGKAEMDIVKELLGKRIPPFPEGTSVPDEVREIIEKSMSTKREDRYATAHEMRVAIEQYVLRADPRGSLAKVGEILSTEFAEQRTRVKSLVEQHIAATAPIVQFANVDLPMLPQSSPDISSVSSISAGSNASHSSKSGAVSGAGSLGSQGTSTVVSGEMPTNTNSASSPTRKRSNAIFIAAAAVVVVAVIGVVAVSVARRDNNNKSATRDDHGTASSSSAALANGAAPPPPPAAADAVELTVRASPANAQIFIDDAVVSDNPFHAKYPRGQTHSIRVVAPGHAPKLESVTLSEATNMSINLEKQTTSPPTNNGAAVMAAAPRPNLGNPRPAPIDPRPAAVTETKPSNAAATTPPPAAPSQTDIVQGGGKAPKRSIDQKNPYQ